MPAMEVAVRFDLITHAAPAAAEAHRFGSDAPADERRLARMRTAAGRLASTIHVVRSPVRAAAETAGALGREGAEIDEALRDRDHGRWGGLALKAVASAEPELFARWLEDPDAAAPDGESVRDLVTRAAAWLDRASAQAPAVLAITHPAVVRACLIAAIECPPEVWFRLDVGYGTRSTLTRTGPRWRVGLVNGAI